ncbi:unnamed protein product, partial [marine sediment metagenome]
MKRSAGSVLFDFFNVVIMSLIAFVVPMKSFPKLMMTVFLMTLMISGSR